MVDIYESSFDKHEVEVKRQKGKGEFVVTIDGYPHKVKTRMLPDGRLEFELGGEVHRCVVTQDGDNRFVHMDGHSYKLKKTEAIAGVTDADGLASDRVAAPTPGVVVQVLVKVGDKVKTNQKLLVLEAMKMQTTLVSPYAGTVEAIHYQEGDQVDEDAELVVIAKDEESGEGEGLKTD